jgi:CubicO group peptidase (beta-lactamase class C family)
MTAPEVRFGLAEHPDGPVGGLAARLTRDPSAVRGHVLEVDALVGRDETRVTWTYSASLHEPETVRRLADDQLAALESFAAALRPAVAAKARFTLPAPVEPMARHRVPGLSIVALRGGEIVASEAYGVLDTRGTEPVTTETLFRVASASKQISALGALLMATEGLIDLDEDVNAYLTSWQLPYDGTQPVTVRHLLANVAGLNRESAHRPYRPDEPLPTALDALYGRPPARTAPIRPERPPGELFAKNRVNYLVLEQVLTDRSGMPFTEWMREAVFTPLGMKHSGYHPGHPRTAGLPIARGHDAFGVAVHEYGPSHPATAAGGLWTTAEDLARAQLEIRRAYLGESALLGEAMARQMLTPGPGTMYGLSTIVDTSTGDIDFGIVGEFTGYWAGAMCRARSGDGYVMLANGDNGREIAEFVIAATSATVPFRPEPDAAKRGRNR